jgi:hypothetical protein
MLFTVTQPVENEFCSCKKGSTTNAISQAAAKISRTQNLCNDSDTRCRTNGVFE